MGQKLKIVITGATGFVGQHLLEDIDSSKYELTVITRNKNKIFRFLPTGVNVVQADLTDLDSLIHAFNGQDVLINLAAEIRNEGKLETTNIQGTKNIIRAVEECGINHVIHLSSVGVYGKAYSDSPCLVDEKSECSPQNEYERTKYISDRLFLDHDNPKFKLTILRPTNVYGEYHPGNALLRLMNHVQARKTLYCQEGAVFNYVYVKDLTFIICNTIENSNGYGVLNVGCAQEIKSFALILAKQMNVKFKLKFIPKIIFVLFKILGINKLNVVSNFVSYSDDKLKSYFQYFYGVEKGLLRTIEFYKKEKLLK